MSQHEVIDITVGGSKAIENSVWRFGNMLAKLFEAVFGCSHSRYSFPMKTRASRSPAARLTGTYVVLFAYDWNEMTIIESASQIRHYMRSMVSKQIA